MLTTPSSLSTRPPPPPRNCRIRYIVINAFLIGRKPDLFVNFGLSMLLESDPDPHSQYGRIRIQNIEKSYLILAAETSAAGLFSLSSLENCQT
jgi:hypothetical protein